MKFPMMRVELITSLESLSDKIYQQAYWVNGECPTGTIDCFDLPVHFLFDDTDLATDAQSCIGYFVRDEDEAQAITALCKTLDDIFDKYGTELTDAEYIVLPEWDNVISQAKFALDTVNNNKQFKPKKQ